MGIAMDPNISKIVRGGKSFVTPREVAETAEVDVATVRDWYQKGKVKGVRLSPRVLRLERDSVAEFLEKGGAA
jgi:predicted site-specific integrase-resolvase